MSDELIPGNNSGDELLVPLSPGEQAELDEREARIERNLSAVIETAEDLAAIRDKKLYREQFGKFEDYVRYRWPAFGRRRADQLATFGAIRGYLGTSGSEVLPENERQIRPLAGREPEEQAQIWKRAVKAAGGRPPSGALVERIAHHQAPAPSPDAPPPVSPPSEERGPRQKAMQDCAEACRKATLRIMRDNPLANDIYVDVMAKLTAWDKGNPGASAKLRAKSKSKEKSE